MLLISILVPLTNDLIMLIIIIIIIIKIIIIINNIATSNITVISGLLNVIINSLSKLYYL